MILENGGEVNPGDALRVRFDNVLCALKVRNSQFYWLALDIQYSEPTRVYHTLAHLDEGLNAFDWLCREYGNDLCADDVVNILLAWCYHDYFMYQAAPKGMNETLSAAMAQGVSTRYIPSELIQRTIDHQPWPDDNMWWYLSGNILIDMDLYAWSKPWDDHHHDVCGIMTEYGFGRHKPEDVDEELRRWYVGRSAFLRGRLARPHLYATTFGQREWEPQARQNLNTELFLYDYSLKQLGDAS